MIRLIQSVGLNLIKYSINVIFCDWISRWGKSNPEFCVAIKKAEAGRLVLRLRRIETGEQGWQGTAWALKRLYPHRFARPEIMNQVAVVHASKTPERVIVLPNEEFDVLIDRPGYRLRDNGDLERVERQSCLCMVRQQSNPSLTTGA